MKNTANLSEIESKLSHIVLRQFRLIFKVIQQHSKLVETQNGVSSPQLWAMWEIFNSPGIKVTELAKVMSIHHSTTNTLINKLSRKNLLVRRKCNDDNRVVKLFLTENGNELIKNNTLEPRGILQQALFEIPEDTLEQLITQLDILIQKMKIDYNDNAAMTPLNPLAKKRHI